MSKNKLNKSSKSNKSGTKAKKSGKASVKGVKAAKTVKRVEVANPRSVRLGKAVWDQVDWQKNDATIARELSVSREAVRLQRKNRGEAQSPDWHQRENSVKQAIQELDTTEMTPKQIAEKVGASSVVYVKLLLKQLGKTHQKDVDGRIERAKYNWASVDWTKKNREIAAELGCDAGVVASRRFLNKLRSAAIEAAAKRVAAAKKGAAARKAKAEARLRKNEKDRARRAAAKAKVDAAKTAAVPVQADTSVTG